MKESSEDYMFTIPIPEAYREACEFLQKHILPLLQKHILPLSGYLGRKPISHANLWKQPAVISIDVNESLDQWDRFPRSG